MKRYETIGTPSKEKEMIIKKLGDLKPAEFDEEIKIIYPKIKKITFESEDVRFVKLEKKIKKMLKKSKKTTPSHYFIRD